MKVTKEQSCLQGLDQCLWFCGKGGGHEERGTNTTEFIPLRGFANHMSAFTVLYNYSVWLEMYSLYCDCVCEHVSVSSCILYLTGLTLWGHAAGLHK